MTSSMYYIFRPAFNCLIFLLILVSFSCKRESIEPVNSHTPEIKLWDYIEEDEDLPQISSFYELNIDREGVLWIGGSYARPTTGEWTAGIWKFNDSQWEFVAEFDSAYPNALDRTFISRIRFDHSNNAYFGLGNKLIQFRNKQFTEFTFPKPLHQYSSIKVLHIDQHDRIWVGGGFYFGNYFQGQWTLYELPDSNYSHFYDIQPMNDEIWVTTLDGIYHYQNDTIQFLDDIIINEDDPSTLDTIQHYGQPFGMAANQDGSVYITTKLGLLIRENDKWQLLNEGNSPLVGNIISLTTDQKNAVLVGSYKGFHRLQNGQWQNLGSTVPRTCGDHGIYDIEVDPDNKVWILSDCKNIFRQK